VLKEKAWASPLQALQASPQEQEPPAKALPEYFPEYQETNFVVAEELKG
jgi:hypothetical protein